MLQITFLYKFSIQLNIISNMSNCQFSRKLSLEIMSNKKNIIFGWIAVSISALFTNLWTFWSINENFHEGWYFENTQENIRMMLGQYLLVPLGFMLLAFVSILSNRAGAFLHLLLAVGALLLFGNLDAGLFFIVLPIVILCILYWYADIQMKRLALFITVALPFLQMIFIGAFHFYNVSQRVNDKNFESRSITGNGVELTWAPKGPGWPDDGTSWEDAVQICKRLNVDGKTLSDTAVNIWRLPTIEEAVKSSVYHGQNAGGSWDPINNKADYKHQPDKESPLWNAHLKTIYWWTSTELNSDQAYIIVYNGEVWPRNKKLKVGYLNFRAVKGKI